LEEIVAVPVKKTENTTGGGIRCADHATPSIRKSWYYFAKKRRSLFEKMQKYERSIQNINTKESWNRVCGAFFFSLISLF
jgi:hypothetical protein